MEARDMNRLSRRQKSNIYRHGNVDVRETHTTHATVKFDTVPSRFA